MEKNKILWTEGIPLLCRYPQRGWLLQELIHFRFEHLNNLLDLQVDNISVISFLFVSITFDNKICISVSANLLPRQDLLPYPNGRETNGWILWGHLEDSSLFFNHLSGRNSCGLEKYSSELLTTRWGNITWV